MKTLNPLFISLTLSASWLVPNYAIATNQKTEQAYPIETISITASRYQQAIADIPSTVWVIDNEALNSAVRTGADLKTALGQLVPSLDFGGQSRTNFAQNLRGRRALVMIDGASLNASRQISRQLDSIDPFNIDRIEVLSGATALYGAGAAGGIINIVTKKGSAVNSSTSGDAYGNANTTSSRLWHEAMTGLEGKVAFTSGFEDSDDRDRQLALAKRLQTENLNARFALAYNETKAKFDADGERIFPDITQTDTQFNDTLDAQINLGYHYDKHQSISALLQYYLSEQDTQYGAYLGPQLAGLFGFPEQIEIRADLQLTDQPETQRDLYQVQYQHASLFGQTFLAQVFHRTESFRFFPFPFIFRVQGSPFPGDSFPVYGASQQNTDITGIKFAFSCQCQGMEFTYGLDADIESFDASQSIFDIGTALASGGLDFAPTQQLQRYPDVDSMHWAAFAQTTWRASTHWQFSAGLRHQYTQHDIAPFTGVLQQHLHQLGFYPTTPDTIPGGKSHFTETLFNAGVIYRINDDQQLWVNASQGFDLPDPVRFYGLGEYNGLYGEGPLLLNNVDIASNQLSGIKTDSYELGWRQQANRYQAQISAYYALSDKSTAFDPATLSIVLNNDEKRTFGVEGQLTFDFSDYIYMSFYAHLINSDVKTTGRWEALTAQEASADTGSLHLGYRADNLQVALQWQVTRDYEDSDENRLEGFNLASLSGFYQLETGKLSFGIQNLFNKQYQTTWSQRAQLIYGTLSAPSLFYYPGQGRRFSLSYEFSF